MVFFGFFEMFMFQFCKVQRKEKGTTSLMPELRLEFLDISDVFQDQA
jgi:hypothetical protein